MKAASIKRTGYSLIELLIAIAIMTMLMGMGMAAMNAAESDARRSRARDQILRLNQVVNEIYANEAHRRFTVQPGSGNGFIHPGLLRGVRDTNTQSQINSVRLALNQVRLQLQRDWLRVAMPERITDVTMDPIRIRATVYNQGNGNSGFIYPDDPGIASSPRVDSLRRSRWNRYRQQVFQLVAAKAQVDGRDISGLSFDETISNLWSDAHQDAECLYLLLASSVISSGSAKEMLRDSEIGDKDGDGVPEVLDPWGNPVGFMRWPSGYWVAYPSRMETDATVRADAITKRVAELGADATDLWRADARYRNTDPIDNPFNIRPMVCSAGLDGVFDLVTHWRTGTAFDSTNYYSAGDLDPYQGGVQGGKANGVDYTAGISTQFHSRLLDGLVGAYADENGDSSDNSVDNIFPY